MMLVAPDHSCEYSGKISDFRVSGWVSLTITVASRRVSESTVRVDWIMVRTNPHMAATTSESVQGESPIESSGGVLRVGYCEWNDFPFASRAGTGIDVQSSLKDLYAGTGRRELGEKGVTERRKGGRTKDVPRISNW